MVNAIAELGIYNKQQNPNLSSFDIWLEDSFDQKNYPHLLLIVFEKINDSWEYKNIEYREHSTNFKAKLLYKFGSPGGPNKTLTSKIAKGIESTFNRKIKNWFKNNSSKSFLQKNEKEFLNHLKTKIEDKNEEILNDINKALGTIPKKDGTVLSCLFTEAEKEEFIGDIPFFSKFITEESVFSYKYSKRYKTYSFANDKVCSICSKVRQEVFGLFNALSYSTIDKSGMITSGFNREESWKNFPICVNCALDIESGYKIIKEKLDFNFYGLRYFAIPKLIIQNPTSEILYELLNFNKTPTISNKSKNRLTNQEDEIFELFKEETNVATLNLLFYDKPQSSNLRILAAIEDVFPSRIKKLFDVKVVIDEMFLFKAEKDDKRIFSFTFGTLRLFFPNSKFEGNFDKSFLELVQKIFNNERIEYSMLLHRIMEKLQYDYKKNDSNWFSAIASFMLLNFLNQLKLFKFNKEVYLEKQFLNEFEIESKEAFQEKVDLFFSQFNDFFKIKESKPIFLIGVLAQFLLNIQKQEKNATPFRTRLKGLKMTSRDIVTIFPEIIDKLEQYKKNYYSKLEHLISEYLISAGDYNSWKSGIDEMNYLFVLGMNLSNYFKIKNEKQEDNNDNS